MTASSSSSKEMRAAAQARGRPRFVRRAAAAFVMLLAFAAAAGAAEVTKGEVKVVTDGGYARLDFHFEHEVPATIRFAFPILVVNFSKPVALDVARLKAGAPDYINAARLDPDGGALRIALANKVNVNSLPVGDRLFIDLLPEDWVGVMPGLPREVIDELANRAREADKVLRKQQLSAKFKKLDTIRVRVASQPTFVRYVFELPDVANVVPERADSTLTLNFDQQIKWDLADAKAAMPPTLKSIETTIDDDISAVTFTFNGTPKVRTFREDRSIVVDLDRDAGKLKPAAAAPPAAPKQAAAAPAAVPVTSPAIEPPETVPVEKHAAAKEVAVPAEPSDVAPLDSENKAAPTPAPDAKEAKPAAAPAVTAPAAPAEANAKPEPAPKPAAADDRKRVPPDPNAPVVADLHRSGDNLRVYFPFAVPTPAAVFSRADMLWLVFDSAAKIGLAALGAESGVVIRSAVQERGEDGEAILRIKLGRPRLISLEADGPGWIVNIGDAITVPSRPLVIARSIVGKKHASIAIPFDHPFKIHKIVDRDVGDRLMVVTGLTPARGFLKAQDFVELRALPSTQGVVLQPLADDVGAELAADKITISRPGGLSLSATGLGQQQLATNFRAMTFDTQLWGFDRQAMFSPRQAELINDAAMAPPPRRRQARLKLARFYLAREMSAEAKGVLDVALADEHGTDDITGSVLKAVADVMLDRPNEAIKVLSNPQVGDQVDAPIWRAIAYARQGKWPEAHAAFKKIERAIGALPIELQRIALRDALRASIEVRDFKAAERLLNEVETLGVPPGLEASIAVLAGRLDEGLGRNEDALTNYRSAASARDRRAAAQGRLREIVLRFSNNDMARKDVIHELETLTTIWRGDETEAEGLKVLAHLYTEDQRFRDAFHVMRTAMLAHPNSDLTRKIQDEAAVTFDSLFLTDKSDAMSPIEALGMFYDFRELTPIGRRGDEMIRKLADRLVSVDLLGQAAELLQHQVDHRLQGAARAQVATKLAVIYMMDHKADRALATLRATRTDGLSNELRDQRLLLEARALSDGGRHDLALELIGNIDSREATRLRSDVLWAARRWRAAAEQLEILYGSRWSDFTPLSDQERADILRAAIGYALGDDAMGLARFREKYAAKMADGPDRRAFEVVTAPVGIGGVEFQNVAKMVAGTDTLDAFLREMRERYPDAPLPPPDKAAAAPAAKPETEANVKTEAKAAPAEKVEAKAVPAAADKPVAPAKPNPASSPLPPKAPAGTPVKPDPNSTGSITKLPKARAAGR